MIKSKRGSHVGLVLSFVIFATFLVFVYVFLEAPLNASQGKDAILNHLEEQLKERMSSELTVATLNIDDADDPEEACIIFSDFLSKTKMQPAHIIVKNDEGITQEAFRTGSSLTIDRASTSSDFFKVYNSSEFSLLDSGGASCESLSQYDIGQVKTQNYIFLGKVVELLAEYDSDYEELKEELGLSGGDDFGFVFTQQNGDKIAAEKNIPSALDVYSRNIAIFYVDVQGDIIPGNLNVRIW